ncbi:Pvc16 family protein [Chromobacterium haemolyticum]|uniref:Pvc16 family protein n=1 Tax=Chromobacterium haemolyticum TaxID=394935 RepID=UPI00244C4D8E|nr:Pvc16 family protein [Chromobacterium haemolyticum]MDH0343360.1 DUF4255 domain-containing protein [Chromobacterium haemolyticum]
MADTTTEDQLLSKLKSDAADQHVDETLLKLNDEIKVVFARYFKDTSIQLRFDIPDKTDPPNDPTLCVFLYDIQEDLELRHGQQRMYDVQKQQFSPGLVHVRCCYLITYWESKNIPEGRMGPRSQSMVVMNLVLNALLNLQLSTVVPSFKRVIAPSEHLSSLGNFWQALDNKPRLCLNFAVTVPVQLAQADSSPVALVRQQQASVLPFDGGVNSLTGEFLQQFIEVLRLAAQALKPPLDPLQLNAQLNRLTVTGELLPSGTLENGPWTLILAGTLDKVLKTAARSAIAQLKKGPITDIKDDGLIWVSADQSG